MPHPTVNPTETSNEQASMEAWISSLNAPLRTRIMPVSPEPECETPRDSSAAKAKRQREFAAGRRCCESLLKQFGNSEQVWANADRSPAWPLGFTGSISHSKNWTWAAVAEQTELVSVGIDTEPVISKETREQIVFEIATPTELDVCRQSQLTTDQIFSVVFSAKEAFYKCCYPIVQQYFGFEHAVVEEIHADRLTLRTHQSHPCIDKMPSSLVVHFRVTKQDVFTITTMEDA